MAVLASDNFNRANENPLASPWAKATGVSYALQVVSDYVEPAAIAGTAAMYYSGITWPDDQWAQCVLQYAASSANERVGALLRCSTSAATFYRFAVGGMGAGAVWQLSRYIAGTPTVLDSGTYTSAAGDVLYVEIQSSTLVGKINGTTMTTKTDGSPLASGAAGLLALSNTAVANAQAGPWAAGDFSGTTVLITRRLLTMLVGT